MSTFSITEVRLERAPGATHDHIGRVRLLNHHHRDYATIRSAISRGAL